MKKFNMSGPPTFKIPLAMAIKVSDIERGESSFLKTKMNYSTVKLFTLGFLLMTGKQLRSK